MRAGPSPRFGWLAALGALALVVVASGRAIAPVASSSASTATMSTPLRLPPPPRDLAGLCVAAGVPCPPRDVHVLVEKRARRLTLSSGSVVLLRARVGLGFSPEGSKTLEGDGKTPEGELHVVTRNGESKYRRFLGLGYPRPADVLPGLLDPGQEAAIARAFARKERPPWDTRVGGAVGIHGHGGERDWTLGCVAVDDAVIDLLWEAVPLGTKVTIVP